MLRVLGWDIDTVVMTTSVPLAKLERLHDTLREWPSDRELGSEKELLYLTGCLRHMCELVRLGIYFVRRMVNNVDVHPIRAWSATFHVARKSAQSSPRICLGPEFHADVSFWRLLVAGGLGSPTGRFYTPLYRSYTQPPAFFLWSDASGNAMEGFCVRPEPGLGVWMRFDFDDDVHERLRATIRDWNDLSVNVVELLSMAVAALVFVTQSNLRPSYARDTILMRGENTSALKWVSKCKCGREPRSGALMHLLGHLEVGSRCCF